MIGRVAVAGHGQHRAGGIEAAGEDETGDLAVGHLVHDLDLLGRGQHLEIRHLRGAEHLDAFVREIFEETGEGEGRTIDAAFADEPVHAAVSGDELHLELVAIRLEEVGNGDALDGFWHEVNLEVAKSSARPHMLKSSPR